MVIMSHVTALSPLTERGFTYVRWVRELGAGNGPLLLLFFLIKPLRAVDLRSVSYWVSRSMDVPSKTRKQLFLLGLKFLLCDQAFVA